MGEEDGDEGGVTSKILLVVEWRWSGGGGPSHLLYSDTEEVGELDTRCCCSGVLGWTDWLGAVLWLIYTQGYWLSRNEQLSITGGQDRSSCLLSISTPARAPASGNAWLFHIVGEALKSGLRSWLDTLPHLGLCSIMYLNGICGTFLLMAVWFAAYPKNSTARSQMIPQAQLEVPRQSVFTV